MRFIRPLLFAVPLIGLALTQSGCLLAAAAAGTGAGVAYVKGKSVDVLDGDPRAVADATVASMKDLDIAVVSNDSSGVDATIVGRTARDTRIQVTVKAETDKTSKVFIRAGVWGDDPLQSKLLDRIRSNLGMPTDQNISTRSE
jgi:hypothetical protein